MSVGVRFKWQFYFAVCAVLQISSFTDGLKMAVSNLSTSSKPTSDPGLSPITLLPTAAGAKSTKPTSNIPLQNIDALLTSTGIAKKLNLTEMVSRPKIGQILNLNAAHENIRSPTNNLIPKGDTPKPNKPKGNTRMPNINELLSSTGIGQKLNLPETLAKPTLSQRGTTNIPNKSGNIPNPNLNINNFPYNQGNIVPNKNILISAADIPIPVKPPANIPLLNTNVSPPLNEPSLPNILHKPITLNQFDSSVNHINRDEILVNKNLAGKKVPFIYPYGGSSNPGLPTNPIQQNTNMPIPPPNLSNNVLNNQNGINTQFSQEQMNRNPTSTFTNTNQDILSIEKPLIAKNINQENLSAQNLLTSNVPINNGQNVNIIEKAFTTEQIAPPLLNPYQNLPNSNLITPNNAGNTLNPIKVNLNSINTVAPPITNMNVSPNGVSKLVQETNVVETITPLNNILQKPIDISPIINQQNTINNVLNTPPAPSVNNCKPVALPNSLNSYQNDINELAARNINIPVTKKPSVPTRGYKQTIKVNNPRNNAGQLTRQPNNLLDLPITSPTNSFSKQDIGNSQSLTMPYLNVNEGIGTQNNIDKVLNPPNVNLNPFDVKGNGPPVNNILPIKELINQPIQQTLLPINPPNVVNSAEVNNLKNAINSQSINKINFPISFSNSGLPANQYKLNNAGLQNPSNIGINGINSVNPAQINNILNKNDIPIIDQLSEVKLNNLNNNNRLENTPQFLNNGSPPMIETKTLTEFNRRNPLFSLTGNQISNPITSIDYTNKNNLKTIVPIDAQLLQNSNDLSILNNIQNVEANKNIRFPSNLVKESSNPYLLPQPSLTTSNVAVLSKENNIEKLPLFTPVSSPGVIATSQFGSNTILNKPNQFDLPSTPNLGLNANSISPSLVQNNINTQSVSNYDSLSLNVPKVPSRGYHSYIPINTNIIPPALQINQIPTVNQPIVKSPPNIFGSRDSYPDSLKTYYEVEGLDIDEEISIETSSISNKLPSSSNSDEANFIVNPFNTVLPKVETINNRMTNPFINNVINRPLIPSIESDSSYNLPTYNNILNTIPTTPQIKINSLPQTYTLPKTNLVSTPFNDLIPTNPKFVQNTVDPAPLTSVPFSNLKPNSASVTNNIEPIVSKMSNNVNNFVPSLVPTTPNIIQSPSFSSFVPKEITTPVQLPPKKDQNSIPIPPLNGYASQKISPKVGIIQEIRPYNNDVVSTFNGGVLRQTLPQGPINEINPLPYNNAVNIVNPNIASPITNLPNVLAPPLIQNLPIQPAVQPTVTYAPPIVSTLPQMNSLFPATTIVEAINDAGYNYAAKALNSLLLSKFQKNSPVANSLPVNPYVSPTLSPQYLPTPQPSPNLPFYSILDTFPSTQILPNNNLAYNFPEQEFQKFDISNYISEASTQNMFSDLTEMNYDFDFHSELSSIVPYVSSNMQALPIIDKLEEPMIPNVQYSNLYNFNSSPQNVIPTHQFANLYTNCLPEQVLPNQQYSNLYNFNSVTEPVILDQQFSNLYNFNSITVPGIPIQQLSNIYNLNANLQPVIQNQQYSDLYNLNYLSDPVIPNQQFSNVYNLDSNIETVIPNLQFSNIYNLNSNLQSVVPNQQLSNLYNFNSNTVPVIPNQQFSNLYNLNSNYYGSIIPNQQFSNLCNIDSYTEPVIPNQQFSNLYNLDSNLENVIPNQQFSNLYNLDSNYANVIPNEQLSNLYNFNSEPVVVSQQLSGLNNAIQNQELSNPYDVNSGAESGILNQQQVNLNNFNVLPESVTPYQQLSNVFNLNSGTESVIPNIQFSTLYNFDFLPESIIPNQPLYNLYNFDSYQEYYNPYNYKSFVEPLISNQQYSNFYNFNSFAEPLPYSQQYNNFYNYNSFAESVIPNQQLPNLYNLKYLEEPLIPNQYYNPYPEYSMPYNHNSIAEYFDPYSYDQYSNLYNYYTDPLVDQQFQDVYGFNSPSYLPNINIPSYIGPQIIEVQSKKNSLDKDLHRLVGLYALNDLINGDCNELNPLEALLGLLYLNSQT